MSRYVRVTTRDKYGVAGYNFDNPRVTERNCKRVVLDALALIEDDLVKGRVVGIPCVVGDTVYYITRSWVTKELEIFEGKVSMVFQKSDKTWHFRFSYRNQYTRSNSKCAKVEWQTSQQECCEIDFGSVIFTDEVQAKARLKEMRYDI